MRVATEMSIDIIQDMSYQIYQTNFFSQIRHNMPFYTVLKRSNKIGKAKFLLMFCTKNSVMSVMMKWTNHFVKRM